ncbi:MAG: HNH endonuclease, partial [Planctomycetota bacterium]|nr:HNH endonuclease [Planctomycetota bacterium]
CNLHKSSNLTGYDPLTDEITRLFNPRSDIWNDHFQLQGAIIEGRTAIGRTTAAVLNMNDEERVELRNELVELNLFQIP